ncbi:MAG: hypothetical protein FRX48_02901 [Lasallia pustulata]|uniref:PLC-like phosphodiesterase, TIM beta/alpha-barrel domain n=1 Tax=Lasallia pustulata TaxID=136370 RepID=A0A5M8PW41_9LECA|nr:MAG: hypothetical protein FRX48_02901 [Lasallia pustulata]
MKLPPLSGAALTAALALAADIPSLSSTLQNILANTDNSDLYHYPTDLTQGIVPKPIHSHNDYWRPIPVYTALSVGCASIEADIHLINSTLFIGHEPSALTLPRTLTSLYITPLLSILQHENPLSLFVPTPTRNGVFDTSSTQTLYLFIDVKTPGAPAWPSVLSALAPLRQANYLTTYNATATPPLTPGPITVIGTGNSPLDIISAASVRDYFYDAPLDTLTTAAGNNISATLSPIASASFLEQIGVVRNISAPLNSSQLAVLRQQVGAAHARGILVRYYELPAWPIGLRDGVWRVLWDEGVDFINADDVAAAAEMF